LAKPRDRDTVARARDIHGHSFSEGRTGVAKSDAALPPMDRQEVSGGGM